MGEVREVDAITDGDISEAIIATEREIAGAAWGNDDTDPLDETGDRSLESIGDGLEGQHEVAEGDEDAEGSEEADGDDEAEGEAEGEADGKTAAGKKGEGSEEQQTQETRTEAPQGRVPSRVLREQSERARAAETERDALKAEIEALKAQGGNKGEIDALKAQVATLTQVVQGRGQLPPAPKQDVQQPAEAPDIFENPKGFAEHLQQGFKSQIDNVLSTVRQSNVSMSFELAHVRHQDAFPKAMEAIGKLDPANPEDRRTVQGIYNSPNPGEALVNWHKRSETRARVGDDVEAYEARIRQETRDALAKDPEFLKSVVATLRGEAQTGDNGSPRHATRLPPSVKRAPGASSNAARVEHSQSDDSEQSVADAAWR